MICFCFVIFFKIDCFGYIMVNCFIFGWKSFFRKKVLEVYVNLSFNIFGVGGKIYVFGGYAFS